MSDVYFVADDASGSPSLWRREDDPDRPTCLLESHRVGAEVWALVVLGMAYCNAQADAVGFGDGPTPTTGGTA